MREILFRAYDKIMKRYKPFDGEHDTMLISRDGKVDYYNLQNGSGFDEYVLEQFTGLHDATKWEDLTDAERDEWIKAGHKKEDWKGRRIFDGDIVGFTAENELWEPQYYEGTVYFCDGTFWVDCGKDSDDCDVLFSIGHAKLCDESLQIIGNIHNNPEELVEAKS